MDDPLHEIARLFDSAGIAYAVIGGHAVNAWVAPRFTGDVDVTVQANPPDVARLTQVLETAGYVFAAAHGADLPSGPDFMRFVSADRVTTLEIQLAKTALQHQVVQRALSPGAPLRVATPEDLIVLKLIANRAKDHEDLRQLVRLPDLNWSYIEHWAEQWGMTGALRELRAAI